MKEIQIKSKKQIIKVFFKNNILFRALKLVFNPNKLILKVKNINKKSKKNVVRGLHFQLKNKQTKLLHVTNGKILDFALNLKKSSKNFGKLYRFILNEGEILFIPDHYAHGYECLSKNCTVLYHLEKYRDAKNESGIKFNDKKLKIRWLTKKPILSLRDQNHISFDEFKKKYKTL